MADCSVQGNFPLANGFQPTADVCSSVAFLIHKWVPQNLDFVPLGSRGYTRRRMLMKSRAWVGLLFVAGLVTFVGCSTSSSSPSSTGSLFITTQGDQKVSSYQVDLGKGSLTASGASQGTGVTPNAIALAPSGNALFVTNVGDDTISSFTVNSDGTLGAGSTLPTGAHPRGMSIDAAGALLFVSNDATNSVAVYTVSGTTLSFVNTVPVGASPV